MEPPEEIRREFPEFRQPESVYVELDTARNCDCIGSDSGSFMGMAYEHDGNQVVCGIFSGKSAAVPGLLRDSADPYCSDIVSIEEVGLLDSMAFCECGQPDFVLEGWTGIYADCQLHVPCKRNMVVGDMV